MSLSGVRRYFLLYLLKIEHRFFLLRRKRFRYYYLDCDVVIAFFCLVRRQFGNTIVRDLLLVIMLGARLNFHFYIAVECFNFKLCAENSLSQTHVQV